MIILSITVNMEMISSRNTYTVTLGMVSDDLGIMELTILRNTDRANKTVIPARESH